MKVYVLRDDLEYDANHVWGVFSTKEKATEQLKRLAHHNDRYSDMNEKDRDFSYEYDEKWYAIDAFDIDDASEISEHLEIVDRCARERKERGY